MNGTTKTLQIFRAGRWTDSAGQTHEFSAADVAAIVRSYDPALREAPLVVGHPRVDAPAHGWVRALELGAGDSIEAEAHQVNPEFAEGVRRGDYKKISASFYAPDAPNNPKPGAYYLRHVGFLGAQPPAVHGLRNPAFAEHEQGVVEFSAASERTIASLFRGLRDFLIGKFGAEEADRALPAWSVEHVETAATIEQQSEGSGEASAFAERKPATTEAGMNFAEQKAEIDKQAAELDKQRAEHVRREAELRARELAAERAEHASFADELVKQGRLLPRDRAAVVEFIAAIDKGAVLSFADGDKTTAKPQAEWFRAFLAALPVQVDFSERAGGAVVERDVSALAVEARKLVEREAAEGNTISVSEAVRRLSK